MYARSNSSCTFDEQARLQFGLDSGGKPGGIHSAMTKEVSRMLKLQGKDPLKHKRDEGGLKGARVYVSGVYQVRISKYQSVYQTRPEGRSPDTCIRSAESLYQVVSGAYQDCIRSLEGHLPRPGISVRLAVYQACIRSVSASPRTAA